MLKNLGLTFYAAAAGIYLFTENRMIPAAIVGTCALIYFGRAMFAATFHET